MVATAPEVPLPSKAAPPTKPDPVVPESRMGRSVALLVEPANCSVALVLAPLPMRMPLFAPVAAPRELFDPALANAVMLKVPS